MTTWRRMKDRRRTTKTWFWPTTSPKTRRRRRRTTTMTIVRGEGGGGGRPQGRKVGGAHQRRWRVGGWGGELYKFWLNSVQNLYSPFSSSLPSECNNIISEAKYRYSIDPDFSCMRTEVFQEVLADLKKKVFYEIMFAKGGVIISRSHLYFFKRLKMAHFMNITKEDHSDYFVVLFHSL